MRSLSVAVLLASALTLSADTRKVTRMTAGGQESITTEYVQGNNRREEYKSNTDANERVSLWLDGGKVTYQLDLKARKYVEQRMDVVPQGQSRPLSTYQSGKTVDIYFETTDTGETKEFFGRTAKHLIFRQRIVAEPGACETGGPESETDGWYIPEPEKAGPQAFGMLSVAAMRDGKICRDKMAFHGRRPSGLAVVTTFGSMKTEILELSNDSLERRLFEVPSGFEKVDALPGDPPPPTWSQMLEWEWAGLLRDLESWFR